ncbi:Cupin domain-containing protein [Desulfomicrobium norvegicum]|uniref:Cupin domain-containing protein n=1 Tax=Desulfomicrobium norvegicum (strain DSM 1741 / NCIMB 8310) TaxID=52561 RepID=A0A8G2F8Y0_DESNO|nr:cupin domain-containing protein [Desulfomicrobium norvegicum]SFM03193.1 Cupin domain-containing protein [Desulfomicrobium norvegicum]
MQARILEHAPGNEYFFREGCFITELSNADHDPAASMARARVEPGRTTAWHALAQTVERYVILEGRGRVEVGDLPPQDVAPGDVVIIPPEVRQRITCTSASDLIFLAVCTPRFDPRNYIALEE